MYRSKTQVHTSRSEVGFEGVREREGGREKGRKGDREGGREEGGKREGREGGAAEVEQSHASGENGGQLDVKWFTWDHPSLLSFCLSPGYARRI